MISASWATTVLIIATWLLLVSRLSLAFSLAGFKVASAFSTTGLSLSVTGTLEGAY